MLSVLSLVWPDAVRSQPVAAPPVESTAHRHLGFFFRADLGVGYLSSSAHASDGPFPPVSGVFGPLGLAVGGAVAENWILAGELWGGFSPSTSDGQRPTLLLNA